MEGLNVLKMSGSIGKLPQVKENLKLKIDAKLGFSEIMDNINKWNDEFNNECSRIEIEAKSGRLRY